MIILHLSSGQGPLECARAVGLFFKVLVKEASQQNITVSVLEQEQSPKQQGFTSLVLALEGEKAKSFARYWQGTLCWKCPSPYRPHHKRKNWFFQVSSQEITEKSELASKVTFTACRASGAGGQHVNKTNSAVQAVHLASGIRVRVESERSQHANKRLALALIEQKLKAQQDAEDNAQQKAHWLTHQNIERGQAKHTFYGNSFKLK
tara:strand:+ start:845 stop:1462 length:618 start_codon:yes stop_codon:yes gene_type:complete